jgi:hypothetical protein
MKSKATSNNNSRTKIKRCWQFKILQPIGSGLTYHKGTCQAGKHHKHAYHSKQQNQFV